MSKHFRTRFFIPKFKSYLLSHTANYSYFRDIVLLNIAGTAVSFPLNVLFSDDLQFLHGFFVHLIAPDY